MQSVVETMVGSIGPVSDKGFGPNMDFGLHFGFPFKGNRFGFHLPEHRLPNCRHVRQGIQGPPDPNFSPVAAIGHEAQLGGLDGALAVHEEVSCFASLFVSSAREREREP